MKWEDKPEGSIENLRWGLFTGMYSSLGQAIRWLEQDLVFKRLLETVRSSEESAWDAAARAWELAYDEEDDENFIHPYEAAMLAILYALALARRQEQFELACEPIREIGHRARMAASLADGLAPPPLSEEDLLDMEAATVLFGWKWVHKPNPTVGFVSIGTVVEPDHELTEGAQLGKGEFQWRNPKVPRFATDPTLLDQVVTRAKTMGAGDLLIGGGPGSWTARFFLPSSQKASGSASTICGAVTSAAVGVGRLQEGGS